MTVFFKMKRGESINEIMLPVLYTIMVLLILGNDRMWVGMFSPLVVKHATVFLTTAGNTGDKRPEQWCSFYETNFSSKLFNMNLCLCLDFSFLTLIRLLGGLT